MPNSIGIILLVALVVWSLAFLVWFFSRDKTIETSDDTIFRAVREGRNDFS